MPTDRNIVVIYQRMNDKIQVEKSLLLCSNAIVWSDLHKMDKSFAEWISHQHVLYYNLIKRYLGNG